jgi:uncharacterized spore protein YtfJ
LAVKVKELLEQVRDTMTVRRVFGEPIERDGVMIIPVAGVRGGAGGGGGSGEATQGSPEGYGAGWGMNASPKGVFVVENGQARWQPAVDVNRIILGGQIVAIAALLVFRSIVKRRSRS